MLSSKILSPLFSEPRISAFASDSKQSVLGHPMHLNGSWVGQSYRGGVVTTVWSPCELHFDFTQGRVTGRGFSRWKNEYIPFQIQGCFNRKLTNVELIKTHTHPEFGSTLHLSLRLDASLPTPRMEGSFLHGQVVLVKADMPEPSMSREGLPYNNNMTNVNDLSIAISTPSPNPNPMLASAITSTNTPTHTAISTTPSPAPAATASPSEDSLDSFLSRLFGAEGSRYAQLLADNEIDFEALRLMSEAHLKELGLPMGPRVKIANALKQLNAMSMSASAATPSSSSSGGSHVVPTQIQTPSHFLCPISQEVMEDPVVLGDGFSYERADIQKWLETNKRSPMTNLMLGSKALTPNMVLKQEIAEWISKNGRPE